MVEGKLHVEGEVIHVIVQGCHNFSKLLRSLTASPDDTLQITLSRADEKSIPTEVDKRIQANEKKETIFTEGKISDDLHWKVYDRADGPNE